MRLTFPRRSDWHCVRLHSHIHSFGRRRPSSSSEQCTCCAFLVSLSVSATLPCMFCNSSSHSPAQFLWSFSISNSRTSSFSFDVQDNSNHMTSSFFTKKHVVCVRVLMKSSAHPACVTGPQRAMAWSMCENGSICCRRERSAQQTWNNKHG